MGRKLAIALGAALLPAVWVAREPREAARGEEDLVRRGDYITHSVAMCVICHSGRDAAGVVLPGQEFLGGVITALPTHDDGGGDWAFRAPRLAGLPGYDEELFLRLLMEGIARDGLPPLRPMPPFRMAREDASAVYAYLKSLR